MLKRLVVISLIIATVFFSACADNSAAEESSSPVNTDTVSDGYRIGYSCMDMSDSLNIEFCEYLKQCCDTLDIELVLHDGKSDVAQQIAVLEKWVDEDIDAVICSPVDPNAIQYSADMCMEADIPFINIDSECERKTAYIGVSQFEYGYAAGKIAAEWINENLQDREVVTCGILDTPQSFDYIDRANGMIAGLTENCSKAKIVAHEGYTSEAEAYQAAWHMLEADIFIDCFVTATEAGLNGAYNAMLATGIDTSQKCLVGLGASSEVLKKIENGTMVRGTVDLGGYRFAQLTIDVTVEAINGLLPVSKIKLNIVPVTIDNVQEYKINP